jgi:hypothetical protein
VSGLINAFGIVLPAAADVQPQEAADRETPLAGPRLWRPPWLLAALLTLGVLGALGGTELWTAATALIQARLHAGVPLDGVACALARLAGPVGRLEPPCIAADAPLLCVLQVYDARGVSQVQPRTPETAASTRAFHSALRIAFMYTLRIALRVRVVTGAATRPQEP